MRHLGNTAMCMALDTQQGLLAGCMQNKGSQHLAAYHPRQPLVSDRNMHSVAARPVAFCAARTFRHHQRVEHQCRPRGPSSLWPSRLLLLLLLLLLPCSCANWLWLLPVGTAQRVALSIRRRSHKGGSASMQDWQQLLICRALGAGQVCHWSCCHD
jgi:hypothetical protein